MLCLSIWWVIGLVKAIRRLWLASASSFCIIRVRCCRGVVPSLLITLSITVDHLVGAVPNLKAMFIMVECVLLIVSLVVAAL
jgi:hypothetical protein